MKGFISFCCLFLGIASAGPRVAKAADAINLANSKIAISNDFGVISKMKFGVTSLYHQQIFGGPNPSDITKFFNSRVHEIEWQEYGAEGVGAFVPHGSDTMYVGSLLFSADFPQIARISALIHEARHTETEHGGWAHVWCPSSIQVYGKTYSTGLNNASVAACDDSEFGAYGVQYVFLRTIVNACENCTEKMKLDAQLYSDNEAFDRISNSDAAEQLIMNANSDPASAFKEFDIVETNAINAFKSGLPTYIWNKKCQETHSCFNTQ